MEQKKEQRSQPQGGKGNQPRREQPANPTYPQRGGASERQRQPTDPNRQHHSGSEIADEYEIDIDDEAGDERPSGPSDYGRQQQQPHKAHKDF
jgi:hypothetical protein